MRLKVSDFLKFGQSPKNTTPKSETLRSVNLFPKFYKIKIYFAIFINIEILSPSNVKTDRVIKFELYQENGVQFYLLVDPLKEKVEVFELIDNKYKQVDKTNFNIDKNCEIDFDFIKLWK